MSGKLYYQQNKEAAIRRAKEWTEANREKSRAKKGNKHDSD